MNLKTLLLAAVATVALAAPSLAVPITEGSQLNINGFVRGDGGQISTANSLDFTAGAGPTVGTPGVLSAYNGTGSFSGLLCTNGNCGTINDIANVSTFTGLLYTINTGLGLTVTSPFQITRNPQGGGSLSELRLSGMGILAGGGFDATPAIFTLTAQGGNVTTFSASTVANAVPVPEPMSLALFGMGLAGLGLARRQRNQA